MKKILLTVFGTWLTAVALAQPAYINYQGRLLDSAGRPLTNGSYTLEFNIYNSPTGTDPTNLVWGPFSSQALVANGRFNVILGPDDGQNRPLTNAFLEDERFVEIKVNGGAPILPRQQILSAPYALRSASAHKSAQASSLIQEVADALCPPGTIVAFGGPNIPSGWLLCDGRSLPATDTNYSRLFAAIGTSWGGAGSTFNIPDLRGMFLRGVNGVRMGAYADPNIPSRVAPAPGGNAANAVGSVQPGGLAPHNHPLDKTIYVHYRSFSGASGSDWPLKNSGDVYSTATANNVTAASETRPNNAYIHYIIKY